MLNRGTGTTEGTKRTQRLVLFILLCLFGGSAYSFYVDKVPASKLRSPAPPTTSKPGMRTADHSTRFAHRNRRPEPGRLQCPQSRSSACESSTEDRNPFAQESHADQIAAPSGSPSPEAEGTTSYTPPPVDSQPSTPRITRHPASPTSASSGTFAFTDEDSSVSFQCSIDMHPWRTCSSPVSYRGLSVDRHHFRVRAIDATAHPGAATQFDWQIVAQTSASFSISANGLVDAPLYPGAPPQPIHLSLTNPHGIPIFVTSLIVRVVSSPSNCASVTNLSLAQSNVSSGAPIEIQAYGAVTLPTQGRTAPTIALVNLPVNQDACQNARFPLSFTGSAHT